MCDTDPLEVDLAGIQLKLALIGVLGTGAALMSGPMLIGGTPRALAGELDGPSTLLWCLCILLGALAWANRNAVDGLLRHRRARLQGAASLAVIVIACLAFLVGDRARVFAVLAGLVAIPSFAAAWLSLAVGREEIPGLGVPLERVRSGLTSKYIGGRPFAPNRPVLGSFAVLGAAYLAFMAANSATVGQDVGAASRHALVALGLLAFALPMFEPRGEVVLRRDRRQLILLLRSFSDDEHANFLVWQSPGWLAPPIEAKLGQHFSSFGPFVALGPEAHAAGVRGAARVVMDDADWQPQIVEWIDRAQRILMFAGTTHWLSWELEKVIERQAVARLIISFPPVQVIEDDIDTRLASVRDAFEDTPWAPNLLGSGLGPGTIALAFLETGVVAKFRSRSNGRAVHQLAVILGHYLQLDAAGALAPKADCAKGSRLASV